MNILFASSEIYPYAKSGGLGDVSASLPKAIADYENIISVMPLYSTIDRKKHNIKKTSLRIEVKLGNILFDFDVYNHDNIYFLFNPLLFARETMYGDYNDNDIRFGAFSYAVLELMKALEEDFDIIHINDWQTALIALLAKERYDLDAKILLTIHNLAYQGVFPKESVERLALGWETFTMEKLESFDRVNFLKAGIAYSDKITTVSPTYAKEILTPEYGCTLDDFLTYNQHKLKGILNGVDYNEFNPSSDKNICSNYSSVVSKKRIKNKESLLKELGLKDINRPLIVFIGRFTAQKGTGLLLDILHHLNDMELNIAIIGEGERYYNEQFSELADAYSNISITLGFHEKLARKMYASADFLLMPSIYEPCGLNQMIAYRYGGVPIVRKTGGLADSVADFSDIMKHSGDIGIGVSFERQDTLSLLHAIAKALSLYCNRDKYNETIKHNKKVDNSWSQRAKEYIDIYKSLTKGKK